MWSLLFQGCCCSKPSALAPLTCPAFNPLTAGLTQTCAAKSSLLKNKLLTCKQNLLAKHNALLLKYKELCWNLKQKLLKKIADILTIINYKKSNKCNHCCYYGSETHSKVIDHGKSCKASLSSSHHTHPLLDTFDRILNRRADTWTNIRNKLATSLPMWI